jgi:hypothetical protein
MNKVTTGYDFFTIWQIIEVKIHNFRGMACCAKSKKNSLVMVVGN